MKNVAKELQQIVQEIYSKINSIPEIEFSKKPQPAMWSKKEILGHLIDSAQNNLRRFICGQYENAPTHVVYDQDFWVMANQYNAMKKNDIITLWKLTNDRIAEIIQNMPSENYMRECDTGKTTPQLHTLYWLAEDYVKHLKHHLNQIIPDSFDIVYG